MENDFSVNKQKWSSRRSRPKMQKNARNRGCGRRQKIYIYAEAGMAKLKKQPKMQKTGVDEVAAKSLYLCRSWNGKVEETAENTKKLDCGTQTKIKGGPREGRILDFCRCWDPQTNFFVLSS